MTGHKAESRKTHHIEVMMTASYSCVEQRRMP